MNEIERLRSLAQAARSERVPPVDVTAGVLRGICEAPAQDFRPLAIFTAACSAAAVVVAAFAASTWLDSTDPLAGLFSSLDWVMK